MKKPINHYDVFDIVVVPFPFVDSLETKKRPAIVISSYETFNKKAGSCLLAMITSAMHTSWPCDVAITDLQTAGLPVKSLIRMKLFTLDQRLIFKTIGTLSSKDQNSLVKNLRQLLPSC